MRKFFLQFISLLTVTIMWSQQEVQYTQYMYNMSVINPAYTTGNTGAYNLGILYRTQWVGAVGGPKSSNLFAHKSINDKIEVGLTYINDNIDHIVKENNLFADFAYKLNLEQHGHLSFGLKAGFSFFNTDFTRFDLESGDYTTDPNFAENINQANFNIGAGLYYNTNKFYIGLSVPYILKSKYFISEDRRFQNIQKPHFYLSSGYVYKFSNEFKFKPAILLKGVNGAPLSLDLTANILYQNRLEFGLGYRLEDAVIGMINFRITSKLRLGYAYDYALNWNVVSSGSHEFFLLYNIGKYNSTQGFDKSPRFF